MKTTIFLVFYLFCSTVNICAQEEILFGPEFTFSNFKLLHREFKDYMSKVPSDSPDPYQDILDKKIIPSIRKICKKNDCKLSRESLIFKNDVILKISIDPNVYEVTMSPTTLSQYKEIEENLQNVLFGSMKESGLKPQSLYGSGHINIDLETAFRGDVKLLSNFFVDYLNHPGMAYGVLEMDPANALPFFMDKSLNKKMIESLIESVHSGEIDTIKDFQEIIISRYGKGSKTRSIVLHKNRLEIRAMRAQRSAHHFYLQAQMFQKKIHHLKKLTDQGVLLKLNMNIGVNGPLASLAQYYYYIEDLGLNWKEYKAMLPIRYRLLPLIKKKKWAFRKPNFCNRLLQNKVREIADILTDF